MGSTRCKRIQKKGKPNSNTTKKILDILHQKGPITAEEICQHLGIDENEFKANFASLRHMELARACKVEDKVCYTLFDK